MSQQRHPNANFPGTGQVCTIRGRSAVHVKRSFIFTLFYLFRVGMVGGQTQRRRSWRVHYSHQVQCREGRSASRSRQRVMGERGEGNGHWVRGSRGHPSGTGWAWRVEEVAVEVGQGMSPPTCSVYTPTSGQVSSIARGPRRRKQGELWRDDCQDAHVPIIVCTPFMKAVHTQRRDSGRYCDEVVYIGNIT